MLGAVSPLRVFCALVMLLLSSCQASNDTVSPCSDDISPTLVDGVSTTLGYFGEPLSVTVFPDLLCPRQELISVDARVSSPRNLPVAHELIVGDDKSATIRFTPDQFGSYFLHVTFNLLDSRIVQTPLLVVNDRRSAPLTHFSAVCEYVEPFEDANSCANLMMRNGLTQVLLPAGPNSQPSTSAHALWLKDGSTLRRFLSSGDGGVRQDGEGVVAVDTLHAGDDEAIGTYDGGVVLLVVDAGVIRIASELPMVDAIAFGASRRGDSAIALRLQRLPVGDRPDYEFQVCELRIAEGRFVEDAGSCSSLEIFPGAISNEGVWLARWNGPSTAALSSGRVPVSTVAGPLLQLTPLLADGGLGAAQSVRFPGDYELVMPGTFRAHSLPWVRISGSERSVLVPRLEAGELVFDHFAFPLGVVTSAGDKWVCAENAEQTVCAAR